MKATQKLHDLGQSLWLDNITRDLLDERHAPPLYRRTVGDRTDVEPDDLRPCDQEQHGLRRGDFREDLSEGKSGEELFFELALEDITRAADLFRPIFERTSGVDGWVSLEVSPLLAHDTKTTLAAAKELHARAGRPNLFIKIPGTPEGLPAIEEAIFAGVPVNVTLLFSREQYLAAAEAYLRGIERRIDAGLKPDVGSVASLFISRWDVAVTDKVPEPLRRINSASPSASAPTRPIATCWLAPLAAGLQRRRPSAAAAAGPAPAPRTPRPPTCCTSRRWPRRSR